MSKEAKSINIEPELVFIPVREDAILLKSKQIQNDLPFIRVSPCIGRLQLLPALFTACGCSPNSRSSQGKCEDCQKASSWKILIPKKWITCNRHNDTVKLSFSTEKGDINKFVSVNSRPLTGHEADLCEWDVLAIHPPTMDFPSKRGDETPLIYQLVKLKVQDSAVTIVTSRSASIESQTVVPVAKPMDHSVTLESQISALTSPSFSGSHLVQQSKKNATRQSQESCESASPLQTQPLSPTRPSQRIEPQELPETNPTKDATMPPPNDRKESTTVIAVAPTDENLAPSKSVFFLKYGQILSREIIAALTKILEAKGFHVVPTFSKTGPAPHYIVIDETLRNTNADRAERVAKKLGFGSERELREYLTMEGVICVNHRWLEEADTRPESEVPKRGRIMWLLGTKRLQRQDENDAAPKKRLKSPGEYNLKLSEKLKEISGLYADCPIEEGDHWKSYMFKLVSGRVKYIGFEITNDAEVLARVGSIRGIGPSMIQVIQEVVSGGAISRIEDMMNNPERMAIRAMMNIWGVGWKTALTLVRDEGYLSIEHLRKDIAIGRKTLERNQYIGLLCYEDLLERMSREEVEALAAPVIKKVKDRLPDANVQIMGSYRRQKISCGDVDILICHPDYQGTVPPQFLGEIVDELRDEGVIAYHLTKISGMRSENYETLPKEAHSKITNSKLFSYQKDKGDKHSKSSYMGVFRSPLTNRMRRVDIKFYPWRQRFFASLYFTGSGFCNRSMRWWSQQRFGYQLTDQWLIDRRTGRSVLDDPMSERDIFDKLKLVWKEPHEREGFDSIVGLEDTEVLVQGKEIEKVKEFMSQDAEEHKHID